MKEGKATGSNPLLIIAALLTSLAVIVHTVPSSARDFALVLAAMSATGAVLFLWSILSGRRDREDQTATQRNETLDDGLFHICRIACHLFRASLAMILVRDRQSDNLRSKAFWAIASGADVKPVDLAISVSQNEAPRLHNVLQSGEKSEIDPTAIPGLVAHAKGCQFQRAWAYPLNHCGQASAVLLLGYKGACPSAKSQGLLDHLLALAAWVVKQEHTQAEYDRELSNIRLLCNIADQTPPHAPVAEVRRTLVCAAADALDTNLTALYTADTQTCQINCDSTQAVPEDLKEAFLLVYGDMLTNPDTCGLLVEREIPAKCKRNKEAQRAFADRKIASLLACPFRAQCGLNGALVAFYTQPAQFSNGRLKAMEIMAAIASSTLSYAAVVEHSHHKLNDLAGANQELSLQASLDGLTGLANHRTLQQTLSQLCNTHESQKDNVFSLAMVDVDHFKIYNDTYGHQEGDAALREIARLISSELRQHDLAARYGGEEFALVLRGVSKNAVLGIAERIRKRIAEHQLRKGSLTVSMGVAEYPSDGGASAEIIERADRALYHAKVTGRNRVVIWGSAGCSDSTDGSDGKGRVKRKVLVVTRNDAPSTETILTGLNEDAYDLEVCSSVHEAVDLLRTHSFDIVLVNTEETPECDIKSASTLASVHPDMPIVLLVGDAASEFSTDALRHGAADVLAKPFTAAELPLVVERNIERRRLERQRLTQKSTTIMLQAIEALVAAIDAKDHFTVGHSQRVTSLALAISDELHLSNEDRYALELAAKIHDIGKLGLPDSALNKRSPLTEEENKAMEEHPALGSRIVGEIDELAYVAAIIRHHHERLDGSGYPDGLRGEAIPYLSRIIAVADSYEAMTSQRAYRNRMSPDEAIKQLKAKAGTHYSPEIVDILERKLIEFGEIQNPANIQAA